LLADAVQVVLWDWNWSSNESKVLAGTEAVRGFQLGSRSDTAIPYLNFYLPREHFMVIKYSLLS
jgi:hypothetical protein